MPRALALALVLATAPLGGCVDAASATAPGTSSASAGASAPAPAELPPPPLDVGPEPLRGGLPGLHAVAEAVVDGLARGDAGALAAVLVDEDEYKRRLFPHLANHASAHQMGPDLLWRMQSGESLDDMDRALRLHGGRALRLVDVRPAAVERRGGLVLHRAPVLIVTTEDGETRELRLLATVIEHEATGTCRLLAYRLRG